MRHCFSHIFMSNILGAEFFGIIVTTIVVTISSTVISAIFGVPMGLWLQNVRFKGKTFVVTFNRTMMAMPPVVAGLIVFLLLMRNGPLGFLGLLFTTPAMIIAQVFLITPIICGIVYNAAERNAKGIRLFAKTMGASKKQTLVLLLKELSGSIYFAIIAGFGRATSEVGAIMIVGGNIRHHTRTMTTSIVMLRNQGDFALAIIFGVILMAIAFSLQMLANYIYNNSSQAG